MNGVVNAFIDRLIKYPFSWVLTGAGISTESGIPDFRSPGYGLWEKIDPFENFSVESLYRNPKGFYTHGMQMIDTVRSAQPNDGHFVLAKLQRMGWIGPIVTQNIDDLHGKAGADWLYEVHGHVRSGHCLSCHRSVPMTTIEDLVKSGAVPPTCGCGGILKPDIILFGDAMAQDYGQAVQLAGAMNGFPKLMTVIGSSLTVSPINYMPMDFEHLIIINNGPTMMDRRSELLIPAQSGQFLSALWQEIIRLNDGNEPQSFPPGFVIGGLVGMLEEQYEGMSKKSSGSKDMKSNDELYGRMKAVMALLEHYPSNSRMPVQQKIMDRLAGELEQKTADMRPQSQEMAGQNAARWVGEVLKGMLKDAVACAQMYSKQSNANPDRAAQLRLRAAGIIGFSHYAVQLLQSGAPDSGMEAKIARGVMDDGNDWQSAIMGF